MPYVSTFEEILGEKSFQRGYRQGKEEGIEEGIEKGIEEGIEKGIEKGKRESKREGLLMAIELGMKLRFGEDKQAQELLLQMRHSTQIDLLQQIVRLLETTSSLDELRECMEGKIVPNLQTPTA